MKTSMDVSVLVVASNLKKMLQLSLLLKPKSQYMSKVSKMKPIIKIIKHLNEETSLSDTPKFTGTHRKYTLINNDGG